MRAGTRPPCPKHKGSAVRFHGTYGSPGHARQRWLCVPKKGKQHTFTEPLPRQQAAHDNCAECERAVALHEGPQTPRKYQYAAREVAAALVAAGRGETYKAASERARQRAGRWRLDPDTGDERRTRHGQLVADWVEVFAPVVFEPHRPDTWPTTGTLVLDHVPFRARRPDDPTRTYIAFDVFCAVGYVGDKRQVWRLEAFTNASQTSWEGFLGALPGEPTRVVSDAHSGMNAAVRKLWPTADLYFSEWHLRHAFERLVKKLSKSQQRLVAPQLAKIEGAFHGKSFWTPWLADTRALDIKRLNDWFDKWAPIIEGQFDRRGLNTFRPADMPVSTGGLEGMMLEDVTHSLHRRRYGFKNRERMNRLLLLAQLHANKLDEERDYAVAIRDWLLANDGRPLGVRRGIADIGGTPSLREPLPPIRRRGPRRL